VIIAVAVNTDGVREIVGVAVGPSEAEPFWLKFLRDLTRRGLRGVKLVISDAHLGLKAAVAKVFTATWQCCRVHFMRNALAFANKGQRQIVLALINTAFAQETMEAARVQWRVVADHFRTKVLKLAALLDEAENDVLAFMDFHARIASRSHQPIRSSGSTLRSSAEPTLSGSSRTTLRSCASSARCCSSRMTSGNCSAAISRSKDLERSATTKINGSRRSLPAKS
jgi:transposase-like protein